MNLTFEEMVSTPENWFQQAWQMLEASRVLVEELLKAKTPESEKDLSRVVGSLKGAMLFLALAVENGLKGLHVYKKAPDLSGGKLDLGHFGNKKRSHDLIAIASKLQDPLSSEETELLERLTVCLDWAAKYHVPIRAVEFQSGGDGKKPRLTVPKDVSLVQQLLERLQEQAGFHRARGWPAPTTSRQLSPNGEANDGRPSTIRTESVKEQH